MAIKKINFNNKQAFSNNFSPEEADIIITADNINEIKQTVNNNADAYSQAVKSVVFNVAPNYRRLADGSFLTSGALKSHTLNYPIIPIVNPNQQIDCYFLSLKIASRGGQTWRDNSTVIFRIEPNFGNQKNAFYWDVHESQSMCSFMHAWDSNCLNVWQTNKEDGGVYVNLRIVNLNNNTIKSEEVQINYVWVAKINNITVINGGF